MKRRAVRCFPFFILVVFTARLFSDPGKAAIECHFFPSPYVVISETGIPFVETGLPVGLKIRWPSETFSSDVSGFELQVRGYRDDIILTDRFDQNVNQVDGYSEIVRIVRIPPVQTARRFAVYFSPLREEDDDSKPLPVLMAFSLVRPSLLEYGSGWYPEETGPDGARWRWTSSASELKLPAHLTPILLSLQGDCPLECLTGHKQLITLRFGNQEKTTEMHRNQFNLTVVVPEETRSADPVRFTLVPGQTFIPSECGAGTDMRELGLRIRWAGADVFEIPGYESARHAQDGYMVAPSQSVRLIHTDRCTGYLLQGRMPDQWGRIPKKIQFSGTAFKEMIEMTETRDFCFKIELNTGDLQEDLITLQIDVQPMEFYSIDNAESQILPFGFILTGIVPLLSD